MKHRYIRFTCAMVAPAVIALPVPAQAGLVGTAQVAAAERGAAARTGLAAMVARADVQRQLESLGVSPAEAGARIAALSDDEAAALQERIDGLPAAGHSVAVVLLVLVA